MRTRLEANRERLKRMVRLRLSRRLAGRPIARRDLVELVFGDGPAEIQRENVQRCAVGGVNRCQFVPIDDGVALLRRCQGEPRNS